MRHASATLSMLVLALACGGGDQAPGPIPQVEGVYRGTWYLAVENDRVGCPAALTITDQSDSTFQTAFELLRRDGDGVGCVDLQLTGTGVVRANRTMTALEELITPQTCTLKQPNRGLTGPVADDSVSLLGTYTYQCPTEFEWTFRFAGSTSAPALPPYPDVRGTYTGSWTTLVLGILVPCPVTLTLDSQVRDDLTGSYELFAAGQCNALAPQAVVGTVTVDGDVRLTLPPPITPGCTVEQEAELSGGVSDGRLVATGKFVLLCSSQLREFAVEIDATRP